MLIPEKSHGATNARKIEKFSKALVNVKSDDNGFATVVGDALEIIPMTNPAIAKVGDEITVKVVYKGQPLTTNVYARPGRCLREIFTHHSANNLLRLQSRQFVCRRLERAARATSECDQKMLFGEQIYRRCGR